MRLAGVVNFSPFRVAFRTHPLRGEFHTKLRCCPIAVAYVAYLVRKSASNVEFRVANVEWRAINHQDTKERPWINADSGAERLCLRGQSQQRGQTTGAWEYLSCKLTVQRAAAGAPSTQPRSARLCLVSTL